MPLLASLPARCAAQQLPGLSILLQAALLYSEKTALLKLTGRKLAYRGMNVGQRVHWLAAGFLAAPDEYGTALESYVTEANDGFDIWRHSPPETISLLH